MAYFPFFIDLAGRQGLIVGGGQVALRKAQKLLPYGPRLTVAAPSFAPELRALPGLALVQRPFADELLDGMFFAIAATDDPALNARVAGLCRQRGILVNVVDDPANCTFLFPALVQRGGLSVGICTGGASPSAAQYLKRQIDGLIPAQFPELLAWLAALRERVKAEIPSETARAAAFARIFDECMQKNRCLTEAEVQWLLAQAAGQKEEQP